MRRIAFVSLISLLIVGIGHFTLQPVETNNSSEPNRSVQTSPLAKHLQTARILRVIERHPEAAIVELAPPEHPNICNQTDLPYRCDRAYIKFISVTDPLDRVFKTTVEDWQSEVIVSHIDSLLDIGRVPVATERKLYASEIDLINRPILDESSILHADIAPVLLDFNRVAIIAWLDTKNFDFQENRVSSEFFTRVLPLHCLPENEKLQKTISSLSNRSINCTQSDIQSFRTHGIHYYHDIEGRKPITTSKLPSQVAFEQAEVAKYHTLLYLSGQHDYRNFISRHLTTLWQKNSSPLTNHYESPRVVCIDNDRSKWMANWKSHLVLSRNDPQELVFCQTCTFDRHTIDAMSKIDYFSQVLRQSLASDSVIDVKLKHQQAKRLDAWFENILSCYHQCLNDGRILLV